MRLSDSSFAHSIEVLTESSQFSALENLLNLQSKPNYFQLDDQFYDKFSKSGFVYGCMWLDTKLNRHEAVLRKLVLEQNDPDKAIEFLCEIDEHVLKDKLSGIIKESVKLSKPRKVLYLSFINDSKEIYNDLFDEEDLSLDDKKCCIYLLQYLKLKVRF